MKKYKINRIKHKAYIGTFQETTDENDNTVYEFQAVGEPIWYGEYRVAYTQNPYTNTPEPIKKAKTIVIRHDTTVNSGAILKLGNSCYKIQDIEPDDEVNGLDILTLVNYSATSNNNSDDNSNNYTNYGDDNE